MGQIGWVDDGKSLTAIKPRELSNIQAVAVSEKSTRKTYKGLQLEHIKEYQLYPSESIRQTTRTVQDSEEIHTQIADIYIYMVSQDDRTDTDKGSLDGPQVHLGKSYSPCIPTG